MNLYAWRPRYVAALSPLLAVSLASASGARDERVLDQVTVKVTATIPVATVHCAMTVVDQPAVPDAPDAAESGLVTVRLDVPASLAEIPLNLRSISLGGVPIQPLGALPSAPLSNLLLFRQADLAPAGQGYSGLVLEAEIGAGHRLVATEGATDDPTMTWETPEPTEPNPGGSGQGSLRLDRQPDRPGYRERSRPSDRAARTRYRANRYRSSSRR